MLFIQWQDTPDTHGTPVTHYTIWLKQSDGVYAETAQCDGEVYAVFFLKYCYVSMSAMREAPFSLPLGQLIEVKVTATNLKGTSDYSDLNTEGAIV